MTINRAITMSLITLFLPKVISSYRLVEITPGMDLVRDPPHEIGLNSNASCETRGHPIAFDMQIEQLTDGCFSDQSSQQSNLTCVKHFMLS